MERIIHAFISLCLDYCDGLFTCLNKTSLDRLQTVQNAAALHLTRNIKRSHITPILSSLHWLPINNQIHLKLLVLTFRALQGQTLSILLTYTTSEALRSSQQKSLVVPQPFLFR